MQAIVSIFADEGDKIRSVPASPSPRTHAQTDRQPKLLFLLRSFARSLARSERPSRHAQEGILLHRYIDVGQTKISFLLKAPLYLVVVSSQGEPEAVNPPLRLLALSE
jgi:hypothetical protein